MRRIADYLVIAVDTTLYTGFVGKLVGKPGKLGGMAGATVFFFSTGLLGLIQGLIPTFGSICPCSLCRR